MINNNLFTIEVNNASKKEIKKMQIQSYLICMMFGETIKGFNESNSFYFDGKKMELEKKDLENLGGRK